MTDKTTGTASDDEAFPPSISTLDAAKRLGVAVPSIQRWLDQGVLRGWKTPGGHRRIELSSVQAYIDARMDRVSAQRQTVPDVLVIDDDPIYLEFVSGLVGESFPGVPVRLARNGFEGLAAVGRQVPSCVITDIRMPHMSGVEMVRHLLQQHAALAGRVLVVSGGDGAELANLGALQSSVSFLPKYSAVALLRETIESMLRT